MTSFKKTYTRSFAKVDPYVNTDTHYWKKYEFPITVKEFSYIDYIDVNSVEPYYIAVTSGAKVDIYHQQTAQVWRSLTRFQKSAYGARFRKDGQLLLSGSEESQVKLFNFRQRQLLRIFKGHTGPVHRVDFIQSKPQIVSFSDDKSVSLWDIADEKLVVKLEEHKDFIRAGMSSLVSEHLIFSGSYDHTVKVWDSRTGCSVSSFDHGSPVGNLLCYPTGSIVASAGGTEVKIWDVVAGKLLAVLSQHHKSITSLCLASNNTRLMSSSLDRHVKIYDVKTYSTVVSLDYTSPILALGVAPGDSTLVVGMLSDNAGLVSFQQRSTTDDKSSISDSGKGSKKRRKSRGFKLTSGDELITHVQPEKISKFDRMLSQFEYSKALDFVLHAGIANKTPHVTMAVIRELIRRRGLATALTGRDAKSLNPIFRFVTKNIRNPSYKLILIEVTNTLLDIYGNTVGEDPKLVCQLSRLNDEIENDISVSKSAINVMGIIEMFLSISNSKTASNCDLLTSNSLLVTSQRNDLATQSQFTNQTDEIKTGKAEVLVDIS